MSPILLAAVLLAQSVVAQSAPPAAPPPAAAAPAKANGEASNGGKTDGAPPSAPSSRPASIQPGGTGADVTADVTIIFELDERRFKVQESWTLNNNSQKMIDSLTFNMPTGTTRLTLDENIKAFASNPPGTAFGTTGPLGLGSHAIGAAYFLGIEGGARTIQRQMPVNLTTARVIIEDISGLSVSGNTKVDCVPRDLNGLKFRVCNFAGVKAGETFEVRFAGLPSRPTWPRWLAVLISLALVGWMAYALRQPSTRTVTTAVSPVSAVARRDQIVRALELLKEDFDAEQVSDKKYERRRKELLTQLADVLREIELAKAAG